MSGVTKTFHTTAADQTIQLGELLGHNLRGGEVLQLVSDLGGGKTTFMKGLASGAGSRDTVTSPTFTVQKQYKTAKLTLYHFDFYRLSNPGVVGQELQEVLDDPRAVVVIEWADIVQEALPIDTVTITLNQTGEHSREIIVTLPPNKQYLIQNSQ